MICHRCGEEAVVRIPFAKLNLCREHFVEFIVSRVGETIKKYGMIKQGGRVILAVSGGKDSAALTHIMHSLSNSIGFKMVLLHIDLGIGEYSAISRRAVEDIAKSLGLDLMIVSLKEDLGFTLKDFVQKLKTKRICSLCGIVKRYIINATGIELKADAVATAHHADDILTYIFKNFILQDYNSMWKLVPVSKGIPGLAATKVRPLYEVYEKYTALYATYTGLRFVDRECPYKKVKPIESSIRRFIDSLEESSPGIKISILRKFTKHREIVQETEELKRCSLCGLISHRDICTFCKLTMKSFGQPLGSTLRELIRGEAM